MVGQTGSIARRRAEVLRAIALAGPDGASGEAIARELGCSRTAVHRHVETLRREGVEIEGTGTGYRLAPGSDPVVAEIVAARVSDTVLGAVGWRRATDSTNDDAAVAARSGAPEGYVIGADFQHAGRGRRADRWESAAGSGLLFSVVLRPEVAADRIGSLSVVVALAVARSLPVDAAIAWPNDVLIAGRKVAGILCESVVDESGVQYVVVGVGINVHEAPSLLGARWPVTCLAEHVDEPRRTDVLVEVLRSLSTTYAEWLDDRIDLPAAFAPIDALRGTAVIVERPGGALRGVADGIDEHARLRLVDATGASIPIASGEARRVRPDA